MKKVAWINMEELGIIIAPNGEYMKFGKWIPRTERNEEDSNVWHSDSFLSQVYPTPWFQQLHIPYNDTWEIHRQIDNFAKNGTIILLNNQEISKDKLRTGIVLAGPIDMTPEQIATLEQEKERLVTFENNDYSFIDLFNENGEYDIERSFYHLTDFYDYIEEIKENKKIR